MIIRTASIITARTQSSRLNNKILKKITKSNLSIDILIKRAAKIGYPVILACSESKKDNKLVNYVKKKYKKTIIFRGNEINKLKRWHDCFQKFKINKACMIDGDDLSFCISTYKSSVSALKQYDVIRHDKRMIPGLFTYAIRKKALIACRKLFLKKPNSEMVDSYFENAKLRMRTIKINKFFLNKKIRLTLDYKEDLVFFKKLYSAVNITESSKNIISYLKQNMDISKINYFRHFDWKKNQESKIKNNKLKI